jgi:Glycosyltransferase family 87
MTTLNEKIEVARMPGHLVEVAGNAPGYALWRGRSRKVGRVKNLSTGIVSRWLLFPLASLLLFFPLFHQFYWPAADWLDVTGQQIGRDFINVWAAPQLAFEGRLETLFDMRGYHEAIGTLFGHELPFHNWSYPLFALPLFWPLAQLPYSVALAVWTLGLWGAFAAITLSQVERPNRPYALILLLFAPACLINIVSGQNGFLSAALMLAGVICLDRRPVMAGILFGLLALKPQLALGLPVALFALGAWRVMAAATITATVLVVGSVALFGIGPWQQYFDITAPYQVLLLRHFQGFYTTMMVSVFAGARTFGLSYSGAMAIQIAIALAVLVGVYFAVRRTSDPCRRALVLASAAPLLTPYAFNYDLTALAAALVWALAGRLPWRGEWRSVYFVAYCAPIATMGLQPLGLGLMPFVLIAVFLMSLRETCRTEGLTPLQP